MGDFTQLCLLSPACLLLLMECPTCLGSHYLAACSFTRTESPGLKAGPRACFPTPAKGLDHEPQPQAAVV